MELMNICMECGYEWEENNPTSCPRCNSGDFYIQKDYDYHDISIEECFILYHCFKKGCICDADNKQIIMEE